MISLSRRRKESSTAFFTHWFTTQSAPFFSATRTLPASRSLRTRATASFTSAGALAGEMSARFSKAPSMTCCMSLMRGLLFDEGCDAVGGLDGILHRGDERHPHHAAAGIDAVRFAADVAPRQHGHVGGGEELAREGEVVAARHRDPVVERGLGARERQHRVHAL